MSEVALIGLFVVVSLVVAPILTFLCVKFGVVAFYRGKQFIDKHKGGER